MISVARTLILILSCCVLSYAAPPTQNEVPGLKVPAEAKGEVGDWITIPATTDGKIVRWVPIDSGLKVFPIELMKDSKTAVVHAPKAGIFRLMAYTAIGGEPTQPVTCIVVVGSPVPPTPPDPPDPGPVPPGPVPPTPAGGLRVLMIYETADVQRLPAQQQSILFGNKVREYLDAKCVASSNGKTKEWRILDKDADVSATSTALQEMFRKPRQSIPWIVIRNDKSSYEGALPADIPSTLTLLKKFGGE
jgi:hypothetical protein